MKKLATLTVMLAAAASASAQSSVTLFGVVDAAGRYTKNGNESVWSLASGGETASRWGIRGIEDLGDGLKASFWLEASLKTDSGTVGDTSSRFFDRRSTVALSSGLGEIRLGRDTVPTYTAELDYDAFADNGVAAISHFFDKLGTNVDTQKRADNMAAYFLPGTLGGLYGNASAAAGEGTPGKKFYGGRLGFRAGAFDASLAYSETQVSPLLGFGNDDKYKVFAVGGKWNFGFASLFGEYFEDKYSSRKVDIYNVGVTIPLGAALFRAGYAHVDGKGPGFDPNDAKQFALGVVYSLSKRTALYATAAVINNDGGATYVVDPNPVIPVGAKSRGYEAGVRHSF
jgi:predicted porin